MLKNLLKKYPTHLITEYTGEELKPGPKIQWVIADSLDTIDVQVKVPDVLFINDVFNENSLMIVEGIGEKAIASLKVDDIVQFERFGFVRIDRKEEKKLFANLAHKWIRIFTTIITTFYRRKNVILPKTNVLIELRSITNRANIEFEIGV